MKKATRNLLIAAAGSAIVLAGLSGCSAKAGDDAAAAPAPQAATVDASKGIVTLTDLQLKGVKVEPAAGRSFAPQSDTVGYIDFNQDRNVQVFTPYQGVIKAVYADLGADVKKGQVLFTVNSPDLVQAESNLITSAGVLELTSKTLARAKAMLATEAAATKDVEQSTSDQQTAEGTYKAARDALHIFGKSDAEIDAIVASRKVDGELKVLSPFDGRVTARNAVAGLLAQPGTAPAPFTVADLATVWMIANVSEYDLPKLKLGQAVSVSVDAYPGRTFNGTVTNIGTALDPTTHRVAVRSEIRDPNHELHPQMLATFRIRTGNVSNIVAVPADGVVREGDGTSTIFVTADGRRFARRVVKLGTEQDGFYPVLDGLSAGEKIATDGALFISNALALQSQ